MNYEYSNHKKKAARLKLRAPAEQTSTRLVLLLNFQLTSFLSFRLVTITMVAVFCSQIILQKSFTVSSFGPKVVKSEDWKRKNNARKLRILIPDFWDFCVYMSSGNYLPYLSIHPPAN